MIGHQAEDIHGMADSFLLFFDALYYLRVEIVLYKGLSLVQAAQGRKENHVSPGIVETFQSGRFAAWVAGGSKTGGDKPLPYVFWVICVVICSQAIPPFPTGGRDPDGNFFG